MPKLKPDAITSADLQTFIDDDSDFAFEMHVLTCLRNELGFTCQHSGTYEDPVTGKARQFDIRASKDVGKYKLALAIECKNIRANHPLLISAVPRTALEAFHNCIVYRPEQSNPHSNPNFEVKRLTGHDSAYPQKEMVGKKTDQVRRDNSSGKLISDDSATFDKLNQAVNSCRDIARRFAVTSTPPYIRVVVPALIIPPGRLWQIECEADGTLRKGPHTVNRTSLFIDRDWSLEAGVYGPTGYHLSHLEIVTLDALSNTVREWENVFCDPLTVGKLEASAAP